MRCWNAWPALILLTGCLDPMADDEPGYSRHLLPEGASVPNAADEFEINDKIDDNDGVKSGALSPREGYADGRPVRYWDLGAAKSSIAPVYVLAHCNKDGTPTEDGLLSHPLLFDSAPGDGDYTPFRSLYVACVTGDYDGQLITSLEALNDAIDMKLVREPVAPLRWLNLPVVAAGVMLKTSGGASEPALTGYYRTRQITYLSFELHEGQFEYTDRRIKAQNVYELVLQGSDAPSRVVFAQAMRDAEGKPNPRYAPAWRVVTVKLAPEAVLDDFTRESDLVTFDDEGEMSPVSELVLSAEATGDTVNRPQERPEDPS